MKKFILVITVLILCLAFISAVYAQPGQPGKKEIDRAISWALSLGGEDSFPLADGSGSSTSFFQCLRFVANAYGGGESTTAYILWLNSDQHPGDWTAPRGSLVFFDMNAGNKGLGHVALCTGNGEIIEAGNLRITTGTISSENKSAPYLGWAWPPSYWGWATENSGSGNILIVISIAGVLILGLLAIILRHKMKIPLFSILKPRRQSN